MTRLRPAWLAALAALLAAAEPPAVPWELRGPDGLASGMLAVSGPGAAHATRETGEDPVHLAVRAAPGQSLEVWLGEEAPIPVQPLHLYRVTATMRRPPRMRIGLGVLESTPAAARDATQVLPGGDYLVAPVWEQVVGFTIVPAGRTGLAWRLLAANAPDGLADGRVALSRLELLDTGPLRALPAPVPIGAWPSLELSADLTGLPRVIHAGGSGLYRLRFTADSPEAGLLLVILDQGHDPRLHWWRSTEYLRHLPLQPGVQQLECHFLVADRRFIHQWLRFRLPVTAPPTVLRDLVLDQLYVEPAAAAAAGLQTPPTR